MPVSKRMRVGVRAGAVMMRSDAVAWAEPILPLRSDRSECKSVRTRNAQIGARQAQDS